MFVICCSFFYVFVVVRVFDVCLCYLCEFCLFVFLSCALLVARVVVVCVLVMCLCDLLLFAFVLMSYLCVVVICVVVVCLFCLLIRVVDMCVLRVLLLAV